MNRFFITFLVIILGFNINSIAQTAVITGKVTVQNMPLPMATVSLLRAADSAWVKTELADENGTYSFGNVSIGDYIVAASSVGYYTDMQLVTVKDNKQHTCNIAMKKNSTTMAEATVTAKKRFIEMSIGKLLVNVEGSSTAISSNVLELLRRLPGVTVDQAGNISMHGKQGVLVLVNDRPTYLDGDQLAEYLRGMTATEISQLELITQPGARYDAAGNTGVINIKLKRNRKSGFNGNAMLMLGQGVYPNEHSSLMLNYKQRKLNLSLNATDMHGKGFADWVEDQYFTNPQTGAVLSKSHIHSNPVEAFSVTTVRLAADYDCTEKTTVGASVRGAYHPNNMTSHVLATRYDYATNTLTYNDMLNPDGFTRKDVTTNAYLSHKFGKGAILDVNADYLTYGNALRQDFTNTPLNDQMQPTADPLMLRSKQPSLINVYSLKADYTYGFKNGIKLEAGAKSSWVKTDNDAQFSILQNNTWVNDTARTNRFVYAENINALYITSAKDFNAKWSARAGLRAEQTNAKGVQYVHDTKFTRQYFSLFPTFFLDYKLDTNNQLELNYGRRIDRPQYQRLNPFIHYSFQYSYFAGNPYLLPQYSNSAQLVHSYKNAWITTLTLSATTDVITDIIVADNATKIVYGIYKNLAENKSADVTINYNKELTKWWTFDAGVDVYYALNVDHAGNGNENKGIGYNGSLYSQFNLGKGWKTELQFYYSGREISSVMATTGENIYTSIGASKKFGNHILIRANVEDPLNRWRLYTHNDLYNFSSNSSMRRASQIANIAFTYNFGNSHERKQRQNVLEEKGRMKVD